jgi:hypothetical protein
LARYNNDAGTSADYVVVELARSILGPDWMTRYLEQAKQGGIEKVLL